MDYTYQLEQLRAGGITPDLLKSIITKHSPDAEAMKNLYERYKAKAVPILERNLDDPMKINNKIINDFFSEIVDTKVGFFAGKPIVYSYKDEIPAVTDAMTRFVEQNRLADLDAEVTKWAAIARYGVRMLYLDMDGEPRATNIPPWEAVLMGERGIDEPEYALRYYKYESADGELIRAEFYEADGYTTFEGSDVDGLKVIEAKRPHGFKLCPLFGYMNNEEMIGDAEKVLTLIDAYDRSLSDVNSEIEAFRSAYLAFYGVVPPTEEEQVSFAESGTFYFQDGQDGKFITKAIQDDVVENHLNRLHENIYRFSSTPDMSSDNFAGQASGVAIKYRTMALENKTAMFERKFKSAALRMFEVLSTYYAVKRVPLDPYKVELTFTRNFPTDLQAEATFLKAMKGIISDETLFGLATFIDDPLSEIETRDAENGMGDGLDLAPDVVPTPVTVAEELV